MFEGRVQLVPCLDIRLFGGNGTLAPPAGTFWAAVPRAS